MPTYPSWQAMTPKATGGLRGTRPKEPDVLSQDEGKVSSPGKEGASTTAAGKEVAEEKVTGTPGWEVRKPGASTGTSPRGCYEVPQSTAG